MDNTPDNPVIEEESFDEAVNKALKATQDAAAEADNEAESAPAEDGTLPEESATTQEVDAAVAAQADAAGSPESPELPPRTATPNTRLVCASSLVS